MPHKKAKRTVREKLRNETYAPNDDSFLPVGLKRV